MTRFYPSRNKTKQKENVAASEHDIGLVGALI